MRKEKEYIPQFADVEKSKEKKLEKCVICGKKSVSLHNGVCFECRKKQDFLDKENAKLKPNGKQFILYMEGEISDKTRWLLPGFIYRPFLKYGAGVWLILIGLDLLLSGFYFLAMDEISGLLLVVVGIILLVWGILLIKSRKERIMNKFKKYNKMVVTVNDEGWMCPCCKFANIQKHQCEQCGILPIFKDE